MASGALFLGWDHGEFGNWFYRMEIDRGGAPTGQPDRILAPAVHSVLGGEGGVVWVGAGGFDGMGATGQLLALEGRTVRVILDESARRCEPASSGLRLPQPAAIHGMALDAEGRPLVLAGDLGVFRIADDTLVPLIQERMVLSSRLDYGAIMNDHPVGIAATERGMFVASRSLGVFAFLEQDTAYVFSQIVLP